MLEVSDLVARAPHERTAGGNASDRLGSGGIRRLLLDARLILKRLSRLERKALLPGIDDDYVAVPYWWTLACRGKRERRLPGLKRRNGVLLVPNRRPATGVDATRCSSASVGPLSSRSADGVPAGTARPNIRVNAPKIPELPFTLNDALMDVRKGLSFAVSLSGFPESGNIRHCLRIPGAGRS